MGHRHRTVNFPTTAAIAFALLVFGCVEPYSIKSENYIEYLVVNGYVTTDLKSHEVKISKTAHINEPVFVPEEGASVVITDDKGNIFPLKEERPGIYKTNPFAGLAGNVYKVSATLDDGRVIYSDPVTLRRTPPVGSVYGVYQPNVKGIQIFVNTSDPIRANFFRWEYVETYVIKSPFPSFYEWLGGNDWTTRTETVGVCYATDSSSNVMIKDTRGTSDGEVFDFPLRFIEPDSYVLRSKYSILVRQFTLSQQGYEFWRLMRDVNETQGSIYDRQPGTIIGNLHMEKSNTNVLGFFDAGEVSEKRIFLTPQQFESAGYTPPPYLSSCKETEIVYAPQQQLGSYMAQYPDHLIWDAVGSEPNALFELLPARCCTCEDLGTIVVPSFWQ